MREELEQRVADISRWLDAAGPVWPFIAAEIKRRADDLTQALVNSNNDETRGRIKALREVLDMPLTLASEREGISAGLADSAPAD